MAAGATGCEAYGMGRDQAVNLPEFPPDRNKSGGWVGTAERILLSDAQQKQVAQATRAALADWFMGISEPWPKPVQTDEK